MPQKGLEKKGKGGVGKNFPQKGFFPSSRDNHYREQSLFFTFAIRRQWGSLRR